MFRFALIFLPIVLLASCSPRITTKAAAEERLESVQQKMTGSFSSSAQASVDEAYYDIDLHMHPIWKNRGHYLYVEQAVAGSPEEPYRQRVYHLTQRGRKIISTVFELPNPERYAGAHESPEKLAGLRPDDLILREGCAVTLKPTKDGLYRGSTKKKACKSTLRGATYATSRVTVSDSFIQSWDRGFDADGNQVWGAVDGGYMFFRQE